jgi:hypothetical protein
VFLLPAPDVNPRAATAKSVSQAEREAPQPTFLEHSPTWPQLAVVNLTSNFVAGHPSGLATETLTVLSICGTIHANLPRVTEVRFLVDGQQRPSLAGHADLTRTYLVGDSETAETARP